MTSPFVDRVEFQVIGRDLNASRTFRDVADAADAAGNEIRQLDALLRSLSDSANRTITITTNVREVLGQIEDNRDVLALLGDRFEHLTVNVIATVDQLVQLNDGITTIDDNRNVIIRVDDDFRHLTQQITATVDSVVSLNDGITTVDDNRNVIVTVDDDFRRLTQRITATVDSVTNLNDGINSIDDNRSVIALGNGFDDLSRSIERSRGRVIDLNNDLNGLNGRDINNRETDTRRVVETISSNRDRLERAGLAAGAVAAAGFLSGFNGGIANGLGNIPLIGGFLQKLADGIIAAGPIIASATFAALGVVALAAAGMVVNAFTAGVLAALGGGVILTGFIAAFSDPVYKSVIKSTGAEIGRTFKEAVMASGFTSAMIDALNTVKLGFADLKPAMTDVFRNAAPLIKPIVDGMMGFARNVLPGIAIAVRNMKPIFDELGRWMPKLGQTVGDFFAKLSVESPKLASALGYILGFVNTAIQWIGGLLILTARLEPVFENVLHAAKGFFDLVSNLPIVKVIQGLAELLLRLLGVRNALGGTADAIRTLDSALGSAGGVLGLIAGALGILGGQADGTGSKVGALTRKILGIPDADPTVTLHDSASPVARGVKAGLVALDRYTSSPTVVVDDRSESTLEHIQGALRQLNGKTVTFYVRGVQTGTTVYHGYSSGGAVFGPGPKGHDSRLAMLAPGEHVLTAREVDAAGGQDPPVTG